MTVLFHAATREIARDLLLSRGYALQHDGTFALATRAGGVVRIVPAAGGVAAELVLHADAGFADFIEGAAARFEELTLDRQRRDALFQLSGVLRA